MHSIHFVPLLVFRHPYPHVLIIAGMSPIVKCPAKHHTFRLTKLSKCADNSWATWQRWGPSYFEKNLNRDVDELRCAVVE